MLDVDITTGGDNGMETITLGTAGPVNDTKFAFYVVNYSFESPITESGAAITLFR